VRKVAVSVQTFKYILTFLSKSYKPRTWDISHIFTRGGAGPEGKYMIYISQVRGL
jgi:hypothetical protein